ncbi:MAG: dimethylsulfonioproprionate lyase family protein [Paracoccaceae bacterium]
MTMICPASPEDEKALQDLTCAAGPVGSGRRRYGAAMYFNRKGQLSDAVLEVYRVCSLLDKEPPDALLKERGLLREKPVAPDASPPLLFSSLLEEVDFYLTGLGGPGIGEARAGLARARTTQAAAVERRASPVIDRWLPEALVGLGQRHPALAATLAAAAPHLHWHSYLSYPPEQIGATFLANHSYAPIIGPEASPFAAEDWEMGLFLIAPHVLYRDHCHQAPELYVPMTGPHGWRFGVGQEMVILPADRPVWNDPFAVHMTKVGPTPFLCLYVWTCDLEPAARVVPADDWSRLEALRLDFGK